MKITKSQLKSLIKEEVSRFKKIHILENRKKNIQKELNLLNESDYDTSSEINSKPTEEKAYSLHRMADNIGMGVAEEFLRKYDIDLDAINKNIVQKNLSRRELRQIIGGTDVSGKDVHNIENIRKRFLKKYGNKNN